MFLQRKQHLLAQALQAEGSQTQLGSDLSAAPWEAWERCHLENSDTASSLAFSFTAGRESGGGWGSEKDQLVSLQHQITAEASALA